MKKIWSRPALRSFVLTGVLAITACGGGGGGGSFSPPPNPVPSVTNISPSSTTAGAAAQTLTINGTNFLSGSTVTYNGAAHTPTFVNSTQLTIPLTASDQATAGTYAVVVTNPSPDGGPSNSENFTVNTPVPAISGLSPSSATAGVAAQTLTINGTNFVSGSTVTYNGAAHTATFLSSTQLTISLSASDQATAGTYAVVVTNPSPGGGPSNSVNFTVTATNPVPSVTGLAPSGAIVGAGAQTLTISGTNFLSVSTVSYNGIGHAATIVSSTELTISLSGSDQATAGSYPVVVTNPAPGGGSSNSVNFTVGVAALSVTVVGLPSGAAGNVSVSGPGGFVQKVSSTTTLHVVTTGTYTISASIAQSGSASTPTYYWPSLSATTVNVAPGTTVSVTVSYQILTGVWKPLGPTSIQAGIGLGAGEIGALAVDRSDPNVMYAGGCGQGGCNGPYSESGAYKTTDGGTSWTQINSGLTDPAVQALYIDQSNPDTVLAGTYRAGIFRSTDAGSTWNLVASLGSTSSFIDYTGSIYAGTAQGVAESTDGGATWSVIKATSVRVWKLGTSGGAVYAGLGDGSVLTRPSATAPWTSSSPVGSNANNALVQALAVNPSNSLNVFAIDPDSTNGPSDLYVTTDGGASWASITVPSSLCAVSPGAVAVASNGLV